MMLSMCLPLCRCRRSEDPCTDASTQRRPAERRAGQVQRQNCECIVAHAFVCCALTFNQPIFMSKDWRHSEACCSSFAGSSILALLQLQRKLRSLFVFL